MNWSVSEDKCEQTGIPATLTLLLLLLLAATAPVSRLHLLARLRTEPVDDNASISTEAELASSVDSVLGAVVPLPVLSLRRILAVLLLLVAVEAAKAAGAETVQLPEVSGPMLPCCTMVLAVLLPAPRPDQQSLSIWT
jgi:hypothetical protein